MTTCLHPPSYLNFYLYIYHSYLNNYQNYKYDLYITLKACYIICFVLLEEVWMYIHLDI